MHASYHEQDGCRNCAQCFIYTEYHEGESCFCTLGAPPRPPCGSVAMGEWAFPYDDVKDAEAQAAWRKWSQNRQVAANGLCDNHSKTTVASEGGG